MLDLLPNPIDSAPTVLLLGAHCDDVEIGCGATVSQLARRWPDARFVWVVFSSDDVRARETRTASELIFSGHRPPDLRFGDFPTSGFPYHGERIKQSFERLKAEIDPDIVFTHFRADLHQDHRVVNELTWNTFRDHLILEYEIPKFDGDLGIPNAFVPLSREQLERKVSILMRSFPSQLSRRWFTPETFQSIARIRGIECNAPDGFAEAFHLRKARFSLELQSAEPKPSTTGVKE